MSMVYARIIYRASVAIFVVYVGLDVATIGTYLVDMKKVFLLDGRNTDLRVTVWTVQPIIPSV